MKRLSVIAILCMFLTNMVTAQELQCSIQVNSNQVAGTDKTVFQNLQTALYEFINNTKCRSSLYV